MTSVGRVLEIRAQLARPLTTSSLQAPDTYLYPRFEALEAGDTPSFAELRAYLRDGIALDYVEAYRLHVPASLAPAPPDSADEDDLYVAAPPSPPPTPSPERAELATRIPLLWPPSVPTPDLKSERRSPSPPSAPQARPEPKAPPAPPTPPVPPSPPAPPSPTRVCPEPVVKQAPVTTAPVRRPSLNTVDPSANLRCTVNPEAQPFVPRQYVNPQPVVHPASIRLGACGTPPLFPLPPGLPPPPAGCWFGPYPAPGGVTLSLDDCDTYRILAAVDPSRAHRFMVSALARAMQGPAALGPPAGVRAALGPPGMVRPAPGPPGMARAILGASGGMEYVRAPPGFGA